MVAVIFGLGVLRANENFNGKTWTVAESVIYNCFHKTAWSLALGWIVFSCHKGLWAKLTFHRLFFFRSTNFLHHLTQRNFTFYFFLFTLTQGCRTQIQNKTCWISERSRLSFFWLNGENKWVKQPVNVKAVNTVFPHIVSSLE